MPETDTLHLIHQAARELQLEITVEPSLEQPGFYSVIIKTFEDAEPTPEGLAVRIGSMRNVSIPMGAEFKTIIDALKTKGSE
jgi:hypothetical protein